MPEFQIPQITTEETTATLGKFVVEPLDPGFGYTYGSSLRRVMLSSLSGAAVTSTQITGVPHEFSTIKGVKEDVTDIILNLKDIVCRIESNTEEVEVQLRAKGPAVVTAGDLKLPAGVEVINTDAPICTLDEKGKLEMDLTIAAGRGYSPAEENKRADQPIGLIPIDSVFSPVKRVAYQVEPARVGQRTDFDRLVFEVETNGSVSPHEALGEAVEILVSSLSIFGNAERLEAITQANRFQGAPISEAPSAAPSTQAGGLEDLPVEELEFGVRAYNCLKAAEIDTVGELVQKSEVELTSIPNFGRKSIDEVLSTLASRGLSLRD